MRATAVRVGLAALIGVSAGATVASGQDSSRVVHDTVFVARTTVIQMAPREPGVGLALGLLVPGGGQYYAGRPTEGTLALVGTMGAFLAAVSASSSKCYGACGTAQTGASLLWIAVGAGVWVASAIAAPFEVGAWNREHHASAFAAPDQRGGTAVGLSFAFR